MSALSTLAETAKAWPFEQARALLKRLENMERAGNPKQGPVVFETGYGPSGLPHIGTFGEVVRTTMVRHAFETLTDGKYETKLICVSDDMDGMRKVPPTVPNPADLEAYMQKPLTSVPDPFGTHESYGAHMGARLCAFLDQFDRVSGDFVLRVLDPDAANDAQAAAWGEYRYGDGEGDLVFLTISTGIGGGVVLDGKLRAGLAGHFGLTQGQDFAREGSDFAVATGSAESSSAGKHAASSQYAAELGANPDEAHRSSACSARDHEDEDMSPCERGGRRHKGGGAREPARIKDPTLKAF